MGNHRVTYGGIDPRVQAKCTCTGKSPIGSRDDCLEWAYQHHQMVERIRAQLGTRTPSLKTQQAWFALQADNPDNPPPDRALWRQLADELEAFVTLQAKPPLTQSTLF